MPIQTRASWIFGSLFVAFILGVFAFGPEALPGYKQQLLAYICSLLAGLFAIFFTGSLLLQAELPVGGKWAVQGGAGFALFLIALFWWQTPAAPVKTTPGKPASQSSTGPDVGQKAEETKTSTAPTRSEIVAQKDGDYTLSVGLWPFDIAGGWQAVISNPSAYSAQIVEANLIFKRTDYPPVAVPVQPGPAEWLPPSNCASAELPLPRVEIKKVCSYTTQTNAVRRTIARHHSAIHGIHGPERSRSNEAKL